MVLSAVIQFETNLVLYTVESENPINTPAPDFVIDITNYEGNVEIGMKYNLETETFEMVENI
jgi:hypothetical protein